MRKRLLTNGLVVTGLAISFSVTLFIFNTVKTQSSYDTHLPRHSDIFRVSVKEKIDATTKTHDLLPAGFAEGFKSLDGIQFVTRIFEAPRGLNIISEDRRFAVGSVLYADPGIAQLLNFGSSSFELQPGEVILSENMAHRIFGTSKAEGRLLKVGRDKLFKVGLVGKSNPLSHLQFDMILSLSDLDRWHSFQTALNLDKGYFHYYIQKHTTTSDQVLKDQLKASLIIESNEESKLTINLLPISRVHLEYGDLGDSKSVFNARSIKFLKLVGLYALIAGLVNLTIFSLSLYRKSLRSYCIRGILGASRSDFTFMNLAWTTKVLLGAISLTTGAFLIFKNPLNSYFNNPNNSIESDLLLLLGLLLILLVYAICQALVFGTMAHHLVKKNRKPSAIKGGQGRNRTAQVITGLQIAISLTFLLFSSTLYKQLKFQQQMDLGFDPEGIVIVKRPLLTSSDSLPDKFRLFKSMLSSNPDVRAISNSTIVPGEAYNWQTRSAYTAGRPNLKLAVNLGIVDPEYLELFGFELLAGELLNSDLAMDITAENIVINEAALQLFQLGDAQTAIGKDIYLFNDKDRRRIKGVIKDYNQESIRHEIQPVIYFLNPVIGNFISLKLNNQKGTERLLSEIQEDWELAFGNAELDYVFLENTLAEAYKADQLQMSVASVAGLASFMVCIIGIIGVLNQIVGFKIKTLSIKKVFGASNPTLFRYMTRELGLIILIAVVISVPIAFYYGNEWLQSFVYRVSISWLDYGSLLILIVGGICSYISVKVWKVIRTNPIEFLKEE